MKNALSEKYKKYLISISFDKIQFYTLIINDLTTQDGIDNVLTDSNNNFLLFTTTKGVFRYVLTKGNKNIDAENTLLWANKVSQSIKPYAFFDLDFNFDFSTLSEMEQLLDLTSSVYILEDFALQTSNQRLLNILSYKSIRSLLDYFTDLYLWSDTRETAKYIYTEATLKRRLKELHTELKEHIRYME